MIIKKSFNLTKEETKSKSKEKLYQPKKNRWCKFVVIPLLIGFILLLILTNIDFTGDAYDKTWLVFGNDDEIGFSQKSADRRWTRQINSARGLTCSSSDDHCTLTCLGGNTNNIYKKLEPLYPICGKDMDLYLYHCTFPGATMKAKFFEGNFRLRTLAVIDCDLESIENEAFLIDSVTNLKSLHLLNTQFVTLSDNTFKGLGALETLNISNKVSWTTFKGKNFLKPVANTLKSLRFVQAAKENEIYDPYEWLQDTNLSNLEEVDFRNNRFADILTFRTFANMRGVRKLNLSNCSLTDLPSNVFDALWESLQHLELSDNLFTSLSDEILVRLEGLKGVQLGNNKWDCACSNWPLLKWLKDNWANIEDGENVKCFTPLELWNENIFTLQLECESETTSSLATGDMETTSLTGNATSEDTTKNSSTQTTVNATNTMETTVSQDSTSESTSNETSSGETSESIEYSTISTPVTTGTTTSTGTTNSTTETTTTTYSTSTTSTRPPLWPMEHIYCNDSLSNKIVAVSLAKAQTQFNFVPQTPTSVRLVLSQPSIKVALIYFTNYTSFVQWPNRFSLQSNFGNTFVVTDLRPAEAYVFCLVPPGSNEVSPFDCRSYYVQVPMEKAWITDDDQKWVIALVVLGACLSLLFGTIVVFVVLRWKRRRQVKKQRMRMAAESPRNRRVSGASYITAPDSEVSLTDLCLPQYPSRQTVAPERQNRNSNYIPHYYEEMIM